MSQRFPYKLSSATRFVLFRSYRYKEFPTIPARVVIRVEDHREWRLDRRLIADATYERPINRRAIMRWSGGIDARNSNDPNKRFLAPGFDVTVSYRVR